MNLLVFKVHLLEPQDVTLRDITSIETYYIYLQFDMLQVLTYKDLKPCFPELN